MALPPPKFGRPVTDDNLDTSLPVKELDLDDGPVSIALAPKTEKPSLPPPKFGRKVVPAVPEDPSDVPMQASYKAASASKRAALPRVHGAAAGQHDFSADPVDSAPAAPKEFIKSSPVTPLSSGQIEAIATAVGQTLSGGNLDELGGGLGALLEKIGVMDSSKKKSLTGETEEPVESESYKENRDMLRAGDKESQANFPKTYLGTELATAMAPGPGGKAKFLKTVAKSAGVGALTGFGRSEAEDAAGLAGDTTLGGFVGGLLPAAVTGGTKLAGTVGRGLEHAAESAAVNAVSSKFGNTFKDPEAMREAGRVALEKLLKPFMSKEQAAKGAIELANKEGSAFRAVLEKVSGLGKYEADKVNVPGMLGRIEEDLVNNKTALESGTKKFLKKELRSIEKENVLPPDGYKGKFVGGERVPYQNPKENLTLEQLEELKRAAQGRVKYDSKDLRGNPEAMRDLASSLAGEGENLADSLTAKYAPEMKGQFQAAKKAYAPVADLKSIAQEQLRPKADAPSTGAWDLLRSLANKASGDRIGSTVATGLDAVSKLPMGIGKVGDAVDVPGVAALIRALLAEKSKGNEP